MTVVEVRVTLLLVSGLLVAEWQMKLLLLGLWLPKLVMLMMLVLKSVHQHL